ncbi:MAG: recombinase family protein [Defluviitaleaceae bacterium]|nr:recombinase family protein [Defluviitaleaceae bacterium]
MARKSKRNFAQADIPVSTKAVKYATYGYTRISVEGERSEDSIEGQKAIIQDYIKDKADLDLRGIESDLGYSGTDFQRPGYKKLMDGIQSGAVQCVVVKDLSRLGRSYLEVGELLFDTFPAYNVRFISVTDQYDSFADDAAKKKLLILFKNLINHMYSRDTGKKIRAAHEAKKRRGELAGLPPYGYIRGEDGKTLAFDGDAAEVVQLIFDMRLEGKSSYSIAKHLNHSGILSPQSRNYQLGRATHKKFAKRSIWWASNIRKILRCETYTGMIVQGKYDCKGKHHRQLPKEQWIRHENMHPAIISREQFDAVQKLMDDVKEWKSNEDEHVAPIPKNRYVGKIFCSRCELAAVRKARRDAGSVNISYYCYYCNDELKLELGLKKMHWLSLKVLDEAVMGALKMHMNLLIEMDALVEELTKSEAYNSSVTEILKEKAKWELAERTANKTLSAAYTHLLDKLLDYKEYEIIRTRVDIDKNNALLRLETIEAELRKHSEMSAKNTRWRDIYNEFYSLELPTKEMIQALISRIEIDPLTNEINLILNYSNELEELQEFLGEVPGNV